MADILIKNMEMPKDEGLFIVICSNGTIEKKVGQAENGYPIYHIVKEAKAIELPSHGRLTDADALLQTYDGFAEDYYERLGEIRDTIINAPTIVEASNGTDN